MGPAAAGPWFGRGGRFWVVSYPRSCGDHGERAHTLGLPGMPRRCCPGRDSARSVDVTRDEARSLIPHVDLPCGAQWVASDAMTDAEKDEWPAHKTTGGFLRKHTLPVRESFPLAWEKLDDETRQRFIDLPHFDAAKFERMVGVNVNAAASPPREIVIEGATYTLKTT